MNNRRAVLLPLIYFDFFDYPLTVQEINYWCPQKISLSETKQISLSLERSKIIAQDDDFYFLSSRQMIVEKRRRHQQFSRSKLRKARKAVRWLAKIPMVMLIGVSGNLALEDADKDDDIDLFIITKANHLWLTRFLVVLMGEFLGRRHPNDIQTTDKLCFNLFLDENNLAFSEKRQDLYTAHEILQLKILFDRGGVYEKILAQNNWLGKFLPVAYFSREEGFRQGKSYYSKVAVEESHQFFLFESLAKKFQLWYMRKKRGQEEIRSGALFFHPRDSRQFILNHFQKRTSKFFKNHLL